MILQMSCSQLQQSAVILLLMILNLQVEIHDGKLTSQPKEYETFFNSGQHKNATSTSKHPNQVEKSKVDVLGSVLKGRVESLRKTVNKQVELVFLVDSSASVGAENFFNELKFVKKLLADFTVEYNATRVAVITFSSRNRVVKQVDHVSDPSAENHKCSLLEEQLPTITYQGGGTYTLGAILQAQAVLEHARPSSRKAVFLVTDGYSNGGDPRPAAKVLRERDVQIFTFGIQNGNIKELHDMASHPPEEHSYILDSFEEFEALARRALHEDLHIGRYLQQNPESCGKLCSHGENCCDSKAKCTCGTHTGHYACLCNEGYYGTGLQGDCYPCPAGTYKPTSSPGDLSSCIPCPDVNQLSIPASTSVDHCRCKTGFQSTNNHCVALECPELFPPEHGYFVNDDCTNVFNAACGIRCESGYKLNGSSIRLCVENGTWTGVEPVCEMKTCPALSPPRHGAVNCSNAAHVFETECHFSCEPGYHLVGSKKRTCLAISLWEGLPALCRPVTCSALQAPHYGKLSPAQCLKGKPTFGDKCFYECNDGFQIQGPKYRECIELGVWSEKHSATKCIDVESPIIKCPENVVVDAEENEASALVRWLEPLTSDNSDDPIVVNVVPAVVSPRRFDIGVASILYTAYDKAGNKAQCNFTITVRDAQPPTTDRCLSPGTILSRVLPVEVSWEEPIFSDNSGKEITVVRSHDNPSVFPLGSTEVIYEVVDHAGNNNTCIITITVQEHACAFPNDPVHGWSNCTEMENGVICSLSCYDGYGFALKIPSFYFCAYDGIWQPVEALPFPDCSFMFFANSISKIGTISVTSKELSCQNNFLLEQLEKHLERKITNRVSRICRSKIICEVENMIAECEDAQQNVGIATNIISYRRKRQAEFYPSSRGSISSGLITNTSIEYPKMKNDVGFYEPVEMLGDSGNSLPTDAFDILGTSVKSKALPFPDKLPELHPPNKIELEFQLTGKLPENSDELTEQSSLMENIQTAMSTLEDAAFRGELDVSLGNNRLQVQYVKFDRGDPLFVCDPGTVAKGNICVKCPVGTYFNVISEMCEACSQGTYQFLEGQFSCVVCPDKTSTMTGQSKSLGECKAQCLPGTFSVTGLEPCETCPVGSYQDSYAQLTCQSCPHPKTTHRRGVRSVTECKALCPPGEVSRIGLRPCFPCPDGYFQPQEGLRACFRCPNSQRTEVLGARNITACKGLSPEMMMKSKPESAELTINDCFSVPCLHGATCKALDIGFLCTCVPGYAGIYCEKEIDECESSPCIHGGTCKDHINGFTCLCPLGYSGDHCEEDVNDCFNGPCFNGATCMDKINGYHCICPVGYVGPLCQYNVDECLSNPCHNGGFCLDLVADYACSCMPGFQGKNCEINIDDCASQPCHNNATCIDDVLHFRCDCLAGYDGEMCEEDINECAPELCMNGATCLDQIASFKCLCPPSYTSDLCEIELSSDFQFRFLTSGILDFVQLDFLPRPLSAVTMCMWMETKDKVNYGTPFSYASDSEGDNLLTLTDYSGFVFYVNMQKVVTDVTANDGLWHHICVTWTSSDGSWKLYKNGIREDGGLGLATGTIIPATGTIVLGQEQDSRGAGFSTPESFIGVLTLLNIWDHVLSDETIASFSTRCDKYKGNVRSWADFRADVRGKVEFQTSHFCQGCSVPETFSNGQVTISGVKTQATVTYLCNPGYELRGTRTQRCLVSGYWSESAPDCSRIDCAFPGHIANGYINGRQYFYHDVIQYVCNPGYRLIGESKRTCHSDQKWSGDAPHCEEILCELPTLIQNGRVVTSQTRYGLGHRIQFTCEDGYKLDGPGSLTCSSDGRWNDTTPVCQPKSCESPPRVPHGHIIGPQIRFNVGSIVRYQCELGFQMKESGEMYCELKNRWAGDLPRCERVSCGHPPPVLHSIIDNREHKFGDAVSYKCDRGYEVIGHSSSLTCKANGTWSEAAPYCQPITCHGLVAPEHGTIDIPELTYGSVAQYSCYSGYELQGVKSRKCRASGEWSGECPTCIPVSCSQPESISNGRYIGSDWTIGNTVTYSCNPGYMLMGEADRICLESGHWLHQVPNCEPVECPVPNSPANGTVQYVGRKFGQKAIYVCDIGHQLIGHDIRVCMEDQRWKPGVPECRLVSCGQPRKIENSLVMTTSILYGGTSTYKCQEGFRLEGSPLRHCLYNRRWSDDEPTCEIIYCLEPTPASHAYIINSNNRYGSTVEYYCDEGYKLVGKIQRICNADGLWDGLEPHCTRVHCPIPPSLANGEIYANDTIYGSVATYSCHIGFELKGSFTRTCLQEEAWSGPDPHCVPIRCSTDALSLENGRIIGGDDDNTMGATIQYECNVGYNLLGDGTRTCSNNKTWSGSSPHCEPVQCPIPGTPLHSKTTWKGHGFKDTVTYSCFLGYVLIGESIRSCLPDGSWSGSEPRCNPIECEQSFNPDHGKVIGQYRTFGSFIEYKCDFGYKLKGAKRRQCLSDRRWSANEPECYLITCANPPQIPFGYHLARKEKYKVNDEAVYSCNEGFLLDKTQSPVICNTQGKWSGPLPTCKIVKCPPLPSLRFGYVEGRNFTYGNIVHFICNIGWKLIGNSSATCNSNGLWSNPFPTCEGTKCPPPTNIEHGFVSPTDFSYGSAIQYSCMKGYEIVGNSQLKCQNDNTWSGNSPRCVPVVCSTPQNVSHATIIGNVYEYGSTITYLCDQGYELHGARELKCTESRTWDYDPPVCEQISCPLPEPLIHGEIVVHSFSQGVAGRDVQVWPILIQRGDITVDGKTALDTSRSDIFHWNDKVNYRCLAGYKLIGTDVRSCQEDGTWSDTVPKCRSVKCNAPENLLMGDVFVTSLDFKSEANYSCEAGYKLTGQPTRRCQANATWSSGLPSCQPIVCPTIQNIPHGYVKWTSLRYGASATYECLPGYKIVGEALRFCKKNGKWSEEEPSCISRECSVPDAPDSGWVEAEDIVVGSTATYHCNEGYEINGTATRMCLTNETWSMVIPKCNKISCMSPPNIAHGNVSGSNLEFESFVEYRCHEGYRLIGNGILTCRSNKMWSKEIPHCDPLPCPRPTPPTHGTVLFRNLVVDSTVHFSCKEGYKVKGTESIYCMPNQTWNLEPPACEIINCPMPKIPNHGKVLNMNTTYGSKIKFQCNPKYRIEGSSVMSCLANESWTESFPNCRRYLCENIPKSLHSKVTLGPYVVGQTVAYDCEMGYLMEGNQTLQCDNNGHWQQAAPVCNPVNCGPPPFVNHALIVEVGDYTFGDVARYGCEYGYQLMMNDRVTCTENGSWIGDIKCDILNCDDPPKLDNSTVIVNRQPGVTEAIYTCNKGFRMMGLSKHLCLGNSSWSIDGAFCEIVKCSEPPSIAYGKARNVNNIILGDRVSYQCHPGFRIVGNYVIECSWQGMWEGKPPHCVPISCPAPPAPEHGIVEGDDFSFQNAVLYSCKKGYEIFGRDNRFCLEDGTWSGEKPICRRISCGEISPPENGYVLRDATGLYGDVVQFSCHKGFESHGSKSIQCLSNGKWSNEVPTCRAITCVPPRKFPPFMVPADIKKTYTVADRLAFFCESGFRQYGELFMECTLNRTWTQPQGICKKISCGRPKMNDGAIVLGLSYYYNDNLVVICPPGTKNKGKTILNCKSDGRWDASPTCEGLCPRPCLNGGVCVQPGLCSCPSGYVGNVCQHAVCVLPCLNGGTCVGPYKCHCTPGFSGSRCQMGSWRTRYYRG